MDIDDLVSEKNATMHGPISPKVDLVSVFFFFNHNHPKASKAGSRLPTLHGFKRRLFMANVA